MTERPTRAAKPTLEQLVDISKTLKFPQQSEPKITQHKRDKKLLNTIANHLNQKRADELQKCYISPKHYRKVKFFNKDDIWNSDLLATPVEKGYKYILLIIDGYTRFAWAVPLRSKKVKR